MEIVLAIGSHRFTGILRDDVAPITCAVLRTMLPLRSPLIHARWSGEACWAPLGEMNLDLPYENATSFPNPGDVLLYPGGLSETEILIAYGAVRFASKAGQLAGNPIITIMDGLDRLRDLGLEVLQSGKRDMIIHCSESQIESDPAGVHHVATPGRIAHSTT